MRPRWVMLVGIGATALVAVISLSLLLVRAERAREANIAQTTAARESFSVAWLVLVHDATTANCSRHLLQRLYRPEHLFVVHADRKGGPQLLALAQAAAQPFANAHVISTRAGRYRGMALVDIELDLLDAALAHPGWRYAVVLSGDAYPVQSERAIVSRLQQTPPRMWLSETHTAAFPERWKTARRVPACWSGWLTLGLASNCTNLHRNFTNDGDLPVFWGTQWVVITREFARYSVEAPVARRLRAEFAATSVPDESFFQTLLHTSGQRWLLDSVNASVRDPHMATNWARRDHLWSVEQAPLLVVQSGAMFARKVRSEAVRNAIDAVLANTTLMRHRIGDTRLSVKRPKKQRR